MLLWSANARVNVQEVRKIFSLIINWISFKSGDLLSSKWFCTINPPTYSFWKVTNSYITRDSTLEEKGAYGIHVWLKSKLFIVIGWYPSIKKMVNYLSSIEGKGGLKDIHSSALNAALFVDQS